MPTLNERAQRSCVNVLSRPQGKYGSRITPQKLFRETVNQQYCSNNGRSRPQRTEKGLKTGAPVKIVLRVNMCSSEESSPVRPDIVLFYACFCSTATESQHVADFKGGHR